MFLDTAMFNLLSAFFVNKVFSTAVFNFRIQIRRFTREWRALNYLVIICQLKFIQLIHWYGFVFSPWFAWTHQFEIVMKPTLTLSFTCWKMTRNTLKILWCLHCKIFILCLAIFQYFAWKGLRGLVLTVN